ncbi:SDR family oxidoreductase [Paludisphaera borealis]|nr:SDR family oxidoreductase [Paludisphaera borealis]
MRIVVTGASGQIGAYLLEPLMRTGWDVVPWSGGARGDWGTTRLRPVDLADLGAVDRALVNADPAVILHVAAISAADQVSKDLDRARLVNVEATRHLADWCRDRGRRIVFTSTDMVFDGDRSWYTESDEPSPILAYGRTKHEAEAEVVRTPGGVAARLSLLYGPSRCGREGFFDRAVAALRAGRSQTFFHDEHRTPLDYRTAAEVLVALTDADFEGVVHVGGRDRLSRFAFMSRIARALGLDESLIAANSRAEAVFTEPRPADLSLDTTRLADLLPDLDRPLIEEAVWRMSSRN